MIYHIRDKHANDYTTGVVTLLFDEMQCSQYYMAWTSHYMWFDFDFMFPQIKV
jgi:hypothetical protein